MSPLVEGLLLVVAAGQVVAAACALGHLAVGRALGVQARRLSLGYGPCLGEVRWAGLDWRLSLLPLGSYVKFASDKDAQPDEPFEERTFESLHPAAQGAVALGGAAAMLLPALLILGPEATAASFTRAWGQIGLCLGSLLSEAPALVSRFLTTAPERSWLQLLGVVSAKTAALQLLNATVEWVRRLPVLQRSAAGREAAGIVFVVTSLGWWGVVLLVLVQVFTGPAHQ